MNTKTLAIKARLANKIRQQIYQYVSGKQALSESMKIVMFDNWLLEAWAMHTELNDYKRKRKDKAELLKKRQAAPQTKSMKKKLGLIKKTPWPKKNLVESK